MNSRTFFLTKTFHIMFVLHLLFTASFFVPHRIHYSKSNNFMNVQDGKHGRRPFFYIVMERFQIVPGITASLYRSGRGKEAKKLGRIQNRIGFMLEPFNMLQFVHYKFFTPFLLSYTQYKKVLESDSNVTFKIYM